MPKKSTPVRSGAQRSRPRASKGFELVLPATQGSESSEVEQNTEQNTEASVVPSKRAINEPKATVITTQERGEQVSTLPQRRTRGRGTQTASDLATLPAVPQKKSDEASEKTEVVTSTTSTPKTSVAPAPSAKGSVSERQDARRQVSQKAQQRNAAALITAEHYSYVKRDLMFIGILALIMFIIIVILYFVPGI